MLGDERLLQPNRRALYALGALLCVVNTYWSIGFITLVQLNYAIAPRFRPRKESDGA